MSMSFFDDYLSEDQEQRTAFMETQLVQAARQGGRAQVIATIESYELTPVLQTALLARVIESLNATEIERNRLRAGMQ